MADGAVKRGGASCLPPLARMRSPGMQWAAPLRSPQTLTMCMSFASLTKSCPWGSGERQALRRGPPEEPWRQIPSISECVFSSEALATLVTGGTLELHERGSEWLHLLPLCFPGALLR